MRDACYRLTARFYFYDAMLCARSSPRGRGELRPTLLCPTTAREVAMGAKGEQEGVGMKFEHGVVGIMR